MQIITNGFKGIDQRIRLPKLALLTGPNGSGKSSIADAIRFAVLGYVPVLGKRPGDTVALMRGDRMQTEIVMDDGRAIRRELFRTGDALKTRSQTSWLESKNVTEHNKEILRLCGSEEVDVSESLDIRELLNASASKRADRIEKLLSAEMSSPKEKALRIAELVVRRLTDKVDATIEDWRDLIKIIDPKEKDVLEEEDSTLRARIIENGIAQTITWANSEKRRAKNDLKKKREARGELETRLAALPAVDETIAKEHAAERDKMNQDLGELRQRRSHLESWIAERDVIEEERALAERRLEGAKGEIPDLDVDAAEKELAEVNEVLDALGVPKLADSDELIRLRDELADLKLEEVEPVDYEKMSPKLDAELSKLEGEIRKAQMRKADVPGIEAQELAIRHAEEEVERLASSPWGQVTEIAAALEDAAKEIGEARHKVRRKVEYHVKNLWKVANGNVGDVNRARAKLTDAEDALERQKAKVDAVRKLNLGIDEEIKALEKNLVAAKKKLQEEREKVAKNNERLRIEYDEAVQDRADRIDAKQREIDDLTKELRKKDDKTRSRWTEQKKALTEKRDGLRASIASYLVADASVSEAEKDVARLTDELEEQEAKRPEEPADESALRARLKTLDETLGRMERTLATRDELKRLVDYITSLEGRSTVFSAFEWALQRGREEELQAAGGPLIREMTRFLDATHRKETPYFRSETGVCEIGWKTPEGLDVPIQALSGGEWVLFAAALTAAVINLRGAKLRILLVEAAETDEDNLAALMDGIAAVSEDMTAAIVMTPKASPREGWALRVAGETEPAKAEKVEATA